MTTNPDATTPRRFTISLPVGMRLLNANQKLHHRRKAEYVKAIRGAAMEACSQDPALRAALAAGHLWALNHDLMAGRQAEDPNPPSSRWLAQQLGVQAPTIDVAHTALGDARWCKAVYDAVTGGPLVPARTEAVSA